MLSLFQSARSPAPEEAVSNNRTILETRPGQVFAWSEAELIWVREASKWDYVQFGFAGNRLGWDWCSGRASWRFKVRGPGQYTAEFFEEGGYMSLGKRSGRLLFEVACPVREFTIPRTIQAGEVMAVHWVLEAPVGQGFGLLLQCKGVTLQSLQLAANTPHGELAGQGRFLAPRCPGVFHCTVRGSSESDSELESRDFSVSLAPHLAEQTWVRMVGASSNVRGLMVSPGADVVIEWSFPLAADGDELCFVQDAKPDRVLVSSRLQRHPLDMRSGTKTISAPRTEGLYSLCVCAGYREGRVSLVVAHCHLAVSMFADLRMAEAGSSAVIAPLESELVPQDMDHRSGCRPQCTICLSSDVDSMMEPCCHAQFCHPCAAEVLSRQKRCPTCRAPVTGHKKIYLP